MSAFATRLQQVREYLPIALQPTPLLVATAVTAIVLMGIFSRRKPLDIRGKHVVITGGSQGLGLSLANILAARGAHITVMARTVSKLEVAVKEIEGHRLDASQRIAYVSADLRDSDATDDAFTKAIKPFDGAAPELVFAVTGGAGNVYGFLTELTTEQLKLGFETNYLTTLWTSRTAAKLMAKQQVHGRIVLVSSIMGMIGYAGASGYAPAKTAIRGLADCLRSEFLLYKIAVHCYFPGTMLTPGFEAEQEGKPKISVDIEGSSSADTPETCAKKLIDGIERGHFFITSDLVGHLFRSTTVGVSPRSTFFQDAGLTIVGLIAFPFWRRIVDSQVRGSSQDHLARIQGRQ